MSLIIVQVGQCGNQVGQSLFETVFNDCFSSNFLINDKNYIDQSIDKFFYRTKSEKLESRAIQIDMEEKVILNNEKKTSAWDYCSKSKYMKKQGSGNNWANGFCHNSEGAVDKMDELMRLQFERADSIDGILVTMSVAGGTGSGVGTRLCRYLRETYPSTTLVSHLVWPYSKGEVCVQSYNAILSVSNMLGQCENGIIDQALSVDAMLLHENDLLHDVCLNRLSLPNIGVHDLNNLISHQLASLLQPVLETKLSLSELVLKTVIHPDYRLLKMRNVPYMADKCHEFSTDTWSQLIKQLNQMIITNSVMEEGLDWNVRNERILCSNISSLIIARGLGSDNVKELSSVFKDQKYRSKIFFQHNELNLWSHPKPFKQYEKSLLAVTNGKDSIRPLNQAVDKAWKMFSTDAFLYQYEKFGLERSYFLDCFANTEQIIHNYTNM